MGRPISTAEVTNIPTSATFDNTTADCWYMVVVTVTVLGLHVGQLGGAFDSTIGGFWIVIVTALGVHTGHSLS